MAGKGVRRFAALLLATAAAAGPADAEGPPAPPPPPPPRWADPVPEPIEDTKGEVPSCLGWGGSFRLDWEPGAGTRDERGHIRSSFRITNTGTEAAIVPRDAEHVGGQYWERIVVYEERVRLPAGGWSSCGAAEQEPLAPGASRVIPLMGSDLLRPHIPGRYVLSLLRAVKGGPGEKERWVRVLPPLALEVPPPSEERKAAILKEMEAVKRGEAGVPLLPAGWEWSADARIVARAGELLQAWKASPDYREAEGERALEGRTRAEARLRRSLERGRFAEALEDGRREEVLAWLARYPGEDRDERLFGALLEARAGVLARDTPAPAPPSPPSTGPDRDPEKPPAEPFEDTGGVVPASYGWKGSLRIAWEPPTVIEGGRTEFTYRITNLGTETGEIPLGVLVPTRRYWSVEALYEGTVDASGIRGIPPYFDDSDKPGEPVLPGESRWASIRFLRHIEVPLPGRYVVSLYRTVSGPTGTRRRVRVLDPVTLEIPRTSNEEIGARLQALSRRDGTAGTVPRLPRDWPLLGNALLLRVAETRIAEWENSSSFRDAVDGERALLDRQAIQLRRDLALGRVLVDMERGRDDAVRAWLAAAPAADGSESRLRAMVEARRAALARARAAEAAPR